MEDYRYYMDENEVMRLQVVQDPDACSPRYDFDGNIGKMMCWHRNYKLGDYEEKRMLMAVVMMRRLSLK